MGSTVCSGPSVAWQNAIRGLRFTSSSFLSREATNIVPPRGGPFDERLPMMDAKLDTPLARKFNSFVELSKDELGALADLQFKARQIKRGRLIVEEGQTDQNAFLLKSGWGCSFKILPDGGRQVIKFPIPGDCIGLRTILLRTSDHSCSALTDVVVSAVEAPLMLEIFKKFPRLGAAFLWSASQDWAMVVEHLVSTGRRPALERTAHFFLELAERLRLVELATETEFDCPLNQSILADSLGLSDIHVNRILRQLREQNLLTMRGGKVQILDLSGLRKLAGFNSIDGSRLTIPQLTWSVRRPDPPPAMPSSE